MRYHARYKNGVLYSVGIGLDGTEITKEEYENLSNEILEKATLVNQLYYGQITIDNVPAEWKEEIQQRVDERIAADGEAELKEATEADYLEALAELGASVNEEN